MSLTAVVLAGCGAVEHVGVVAPTATTAATNTTTTVTAGPRPAVTAAAPTCVAADLTAAQTPLSSGVGDSALAWSLTDTGPAACRLPGGQPSLAFVDAAGNDMAHYSVTHLRGRSAAPVTLEPGGRAWFVTTERTTTCGVGVTIVGGPFRYEVGLPGGAGEVSWAPSYLSGATLSDFCADVSLGVGDLQDTEPAPS